jgi:DNA-binding response OmpR family regulator
MSNEKGYLGRWQDDPSQPESNKTSSPDQSQPIPVPSQAETRHRLRTPLNHIIGYSEMLLEEADENHLESFAADLRKIHAAGKQLLAEINELFDSAHAQDGARTKTAQAGAAGGVFRENESTVIPVESNRGLPGLDHSGRILVVDDDASNRDLLARRLEHEGYTVRTAVHGEDALARLVTESADLILLDVMMPGMSGYEVLEALKRENVWRDIPVIMISALDELQSVVRCIEHGAEDYLPKPFDPVLLRARIGACLEKKRLRDQEVLYLKDVAQVTSAAAAVEGTSFQAEILKDVALREDELGRLARVFQRMALEVQAREQRLKQQIQELRIEVDEVKKAQQIAEITETDYFYQLKQKAKDLRGRGKKS